MNGGMQIHRPATVDQAVAWLSALPQARMVGGGTELVALTRGGLMAPGPLLAMRSLGLTGIGTRDGHLVLGAGASMAEVARSALVQAEAPALVQALLASASPQVRNVATLGGNLLQRTRCPYYRGQAPACHRLQPGSGCAVRTGDQRQAALFGTGAHCVASHASDLAVALLALDAQVVAHGPGGERRFDLEALYPRLPDDGREHTLRDGELITAITLPMGEAARRSVYRKVRDRASFQFALVSLALGLETTGGRITAARLAAGGVGTRPWRLQAAEAALIDQPDGPDTWQAAADAAAQGAQTLPGNAFKLDLLQRCIVHTLAHTLAHTPGHTPEHAPARATGEAA